MTSELCTRCGRPLRDGLCPEGHPQRAARGRTRRRWPKVTVIAVLVTALVGVAAYGVLFWYPVRTAASVMEPASADYAAALAAYEEVVASFPEPGSISEAASVLEVADDARTTITEARIALEESSIVSIPVVSDRPPLRLAEQARDRMILFYAESLDLIGDLEAASNFLTDLSSLLPTLENLRTAVRVPRTPGEVSSVVAAARPIAEQLQADTRALSPTDEMAGVHAALLAISGRIHADIDELERAAETGVQQVLRALVNGILEQVATYEQTALDSPAAAREAGLDDRVASVETSASRIQGILRSLRAEGVENVTIPED